MLCIFDILDPGFRCGEHDTINSREKPDTAFST
jgi:hypothetical protein